jgi:HEAT repeat protein
MRAVIGLAAAGLAGFLGLARARAATAPLSLAESADGALDVRAGGAVLAHVPLETPPLRRGPPRAREVTVDGHRVVELRVAVRGTPREELWIGQIDQGGGRPRVVWRGFAGPRDADGEDAIDLEVSAEGVLEYQTASQVTRCDGAPVRLFPRAFDFAAGRFRPVVSPLPPPARETLVGRRGDPAMPSGRPVAAFHFTAASTTAAAGSDARDLAPPVAVDDGDPATSWTEGLGGDGRGEFLTARAGAGGAVVRGLRIVPGDAVSAARFRARNRVRKFQLSLGPRDDERFDVELPPDSGADAAARFREPYWVPLPHPVKTACATVVITEVTPGTEAEPPRTGGATAISELAIVTDLDGPGAAERVIAEFARTADCAARLPSVVALGADAVLPAAQAVIAAARHTPERECLVEALTRLEPEPRNAIAIEALVAALSGASEREERLVSEALRRAPEAPVAAVAQIMSAAVSSTDDRGRAARILGALPDPRAADALLAAAGAGTPEQRDAVVLALAGSVRLDATAVLSAVAGGGDASRQADLLRVVPAAVKRSPESRAAALSTLRASLSAARPFEVRARAVMALGALGADALPALTEVRAQADEPVLRHLAARELATVGGAGAATALRAALSDADPRVRATAAEGLGQDRDRDAGSALIAGAKQEPWPFVRRAELEALGRLCGPGAADLLVRAVERDVPEVRRAALSGLARCRDPRSVTMLVRVLGRRNEASTVRELAAALLGEIGDRAAAPAMAAALARQVNESEEDLSVEGVAETNLRSLARLGGPDARAAAIRLAKDARHPFQTSAVEALGVLCDPGAGAATLRELASGPPGALALAAQGAEKRCSGR